MAQHALTHNPPENRSFGSAITPDGKMIAFGDMRGLHLRLIDTGEVHDVALPPEMTGAVWEMAWFPDGQKLLLTTYSPSGFVVWQGSIFVGTFRKTVDGELRCSCLAPRQCDCSRCGRWTSDLALRT